MLPRPDLVKAARGTPRVVVVAYEVAGALAVAYAASLVVRPTGRAWPALDNWSVDAFELAVALLCLVGARVPRSGRGAAFALGLGLLAWALGDQVWTLESRGGAVPPTPSVADGLYLLMYPFAYLAIMMIIRSEVRRYRAST